MDRDNALPLHTVAGPLDEVDERDAFVARAGAFAEKLCALGRSTTSLDVASVPGVRAGDVETHILQEASIAASSRWIESVTPFRRAQQFE